MTAINEVAGYSELLIISEVMKCWIKPVTGHIPTHPSPEASPDPNPTLTRTLDLTQGRVGTWPATEQGLKYQVSNLWVEFSDQQQWEGLSYSG